MSRKRRAASAGPRHAPPPTRSLVPIRPAVAKGDDAELILYGDIGDDVKAASVREQLALMKDAKTITVRVNSNGGEVSDGIAIYTALRQHPARKVGIVEGIAASIASVILCACDEVTVSKGSFVMIHQCSGGAQGNAQDMADAASYLTRINAEMVDIYAAKTGKPASEIAALLSKGDNYMTADESVAFGLASSVGSTPARFDLKAVAKLDQLKIPGPLKALLKEQSMEEETVEALQALVAELKAKLAELEGAADDVAEEAGVGGGDESEEEGADPEAKDDEDEDEDKKEEAKAVLKLVAQLTGKKSYAAAQGALLAKFASTGAPSADRKGAVAELVRKGKLPPAMKAVAMSMSPKAFAAFQKEAKTIVPVGQRYSAPAESPKPGAKQAQGTSPTAEDLTDAERAYMKAARKTVAQVVALRDVVNPLTSKETV